ncbi:MAG: hypothetical protein M1837_003277 [Sclerophora amabilis]|nr:MAG: hypothetical protein M1837_003277 [Sclerophora amabilis]
MGGVKRPRDPAQSTSSQNATNPTSSSPYVPMFESFRAELDEHYDRRERVVKTSRDITALSKKMYKAHSDRDVLTRASLTTRTESVPSSSFPPSILSSTKPLSSQINSLFTSLGPDLFPTSGTGSDQISTLNPYRYHYQLSPGIQEFIESLAFSHYLQFQRLISPAEVASALQIPVQTVDATFNGDGKETVPGAEAEVDPRDAKDSSSNAVTQQIPLTEADYVGGIADLVGEMMRFGITGVATRGALPGGTDQLQRRWNFEDDNNMDIDGATQANSKTAPSNHQRETECESPHDRSILTDLRDLRSSFESLIIPGNVASGGGRGSAGRGSGGGSLAGVIASKMGTMKQSVEKVEYAAYGLVVRGSERPKGWVAEWEGDGRRNETLGGAGPEAVESY